ncbi:MAG: universal stress protein [Deltaproteobacteria bacterium]|nr:MAG: universal stress protein [Deltaproteobacteria bacterium]
MVGEIRVGRVAEAAVVLGRVPPGHVAHGGEQAHATRVGAPAAVGGHVRVGEVVGDDAPRKGARAPRTRCRVVLGDPLQRILAAARDADSIVIATAGRTGLSHLLIGSVAEKVVRHAPVPVLTIRPPAKRRTSTGPARAARRR